MLFAAHRDGVLRYFSRMVGAAEVKELTQEVVLRVARGPLPQADGAGRRASVFTVTLIDNGVALDSIDRSVQLTLRAPERVALDTVAPLSPAPCEAPSAATMR